MDKVVLYIFTLLICSVLFVHLICYAIVQKIENNYTQINQSSVYIQPQLPADLGSIEPDEEPFGYKWDKGV